MKNYSVEKLAAWYFTVKLSNGREVELAEKCSDCKRHNSVQNENDAKYACFKQYQYQECPRNKDLRIIANMDVDDRKILAGRLAVLGYERNTTGVILRSGNKNGKVRE